MPVTAKKKSSDYRKIKILIYIGVGLLCFLVLFFNFREVSDTADLQRLGSPVSTDKPEVAKTDYFQLGGSREEELKQESNEITEDEPDIEGISPGPTRVNPAYPFPQSFYANDRIENEGERVRMQFLSNVFTITNIGRTELGERKYQLDVNGGSTPNILSATFSTFDFLSSFHLADLNANGKPEIYFIWSSVGSGSYAQIEGNELEDNGTLKAMEFPDYEGADGYMGHDSFIVYPDHIEHNYPIYRINDPNSNPTGGNASLNYYFELNSRKAKVEK